MPISDSWTWQVTLDKVSSLLCLVVLLLIPMCQSRSQNSNHHHHNHNNHQNQHNQRHNHHNHHHNQQTFRRHEQDTLTNSHILEKEMEKQVYLHRGHPKNLTFSLEGGGRLTLAVTPCASEITWSLYVKPQSNSDYRRYGQKNRRRPKQRIAQFQNETTREVFSTSEAEPGVYILALTTLHTDTYVRLLVTAKLGLLDTYPELPRDPTVTARIRKRRLAVSWAPSPATDPALRPVKYCVSISQIKNFGTHCAAVAHRLGDKKPRYPDWQLDFMDKRNKQFIQSANPIKKVKKKLMFYKCVSSGKTSFNYKKLRRGKKYFVDVFIVYKDDKGSASAYSGTTVERKKKRKRKQKRSYAVLKLGKTRTVNLKHTRGVKLVLNQTLPSLALDVVPCGGAMRFALYRRKNKLWSERPGRHWTRVPLSPAPAGTYHVTFLGKRKKSSFVSVSSSTNVKSRVVLPRKLEVGVLRPFTSCSNVTLQWMESRAKQTYCLYKQALTGPPGRATSSRRQRCVSPSERPKSELVFCSRHRSRHPARARLYTVPALAPATAYRFDLFLGNRKSAMIPYRSVKETTAPAC